MERDSASIFELTTKDDTSAKPLSDEIPRKYGRTNRCTQAVDRVPDRTFTCRRWVIAGDYEVRDFEVPGSTFSSFSFT